MGAGGGGKGEGRGGGRRPVLDKDRHEVRWHSGDSVLGPHSPVPEWSSRKAERELREGRGSPPDGHKGAPRQQSASFLKAMVRGRVSRVSTMGTALLMSQVLC